MNPLILIALLGGGALYLSSLKKTGEKLSLTILNIHSFKIAGGALQIAVSIALDNPTDTSITIKQPNLKAFFNGNEVGNTIPSEERISITANNRTALPPIVIQIPLLKIPSIAMGLFTKIGAEKIAFDIEASTEVNGIPITQRKTMSI
jgi:hypothetical protein